MDLILEIMGIPDDPIWRFERRHSGCFNRENLESVIKQIGLILEAALRMKEGYIRYQGARPYCAYRWENMEAETCYSS